MFYTFEADNNLLADKLNKLKQTDEVIAVNPLSNLKSLVVVKGTKRINEDKAIAVGKKRANKKRDRLSN